MGHHTHTHTHTHDFPINRNMNTLSGQKVKTEMVLFIFAIFIYILKRHFSFAIGHLSFGGPCYKSVSSQCWALLMRS